MTLDKFTQAYLEAALWSYTDESDEPFDSNFDITDLAPEAIGQALEDCAAFQNDQANDLSDIDTAQADGKLYFL